MQNHLVGAILLALVVSSTVIGCSVPHHPDSNEPRALHVTVDDEDNGYASTVHLYRASDMRLLTGNERSLEFYVSPKTEKNWLNVSQLEVLAKLPHLTKIDISAAGKEWHDIATLGGFRAVEDATVFCTGEATQDVFAWLGSLPHLRRATIASPSYVNLDAEPLSACNTPLELTIRSGKTIWDDKTDDLPAEFIRSIAKIHRIRKLQLFGTLAPDAELALNEALISNPIHDLTVQSLITSPPLAFSLFLSTTLHTISARLADGLCESLSLHGDSFASSRIRSCQIEIARGDMKFFA